MSGVTHPRFAPSRGRVGGTWWSKAFLRAVEEAAFSSAELKRGRAHARGGDVGSITVGNGTFVAAVVDRDDAFTVTGTVPVLAEGDQSVLVELIAAEAGRIGALMSGELPHPFVEAVEEAGVELLPYGGELGSACTCDAWLDPCPHALAVLTQLGWLVQRDPFVLFQLRGLPRDEVLARLHALSLAGHRSRAAHADAVGHDTTDHRIDEDIDDLAIAEEAALRAARDLAQLLAGPPSD
ncbi:MAG: SWIM zinc finger family protein [Nocardioides sp.]|uniref:SWIM zinc finger family protein n=1 Tax=Nocardioides sp. TaxID=35761 RepID=UPI00326714A4